MDSIRTIWWIYCGQYVQMVLVEIQCQWVFLGNDVRHTACHSSCSVETFLCIAGIGPVLLAIALCAIIDWVRSGNLCSAAN
jgi:hypothetical protein